MLTDLKETEPPTSEPTNDHEKIMYEPTSATLCQAPTCSQCMRICENETKYAGSDQCTTEVVTVTLQSIQPTCTQITVQPTQPICTPVSYTHLTLPTIYSV